MPDVIINGPEGRIEGRYHHARVPAAPMALVLHPHPQHGGTMNNKVVYTLYQCFVRRGFSTLRFNFRGVGRSQGSFDRGEGELSDAASALDWLQTYNPNAQFCWIAGFSFGAWIGMQLLMRRPEIESFIAVAPPANIYDFTFLAPCPSSGLVLQAIRIPWCRWSRYSGWSPSWRTSATSRLISVRSRAPIITSPTASIQSPATSMATSASTPGSASLPSPRSGPSANQRRGRAPTRCPRARGWWRAAPRVPRSAPPAVRCI